MSYPNDPLEYTLYAEDGKTRVGSITVRPAERKEVEERDGRRFKLKLSKRGYCYVRLPEEAKASSGKERRS